MIIMISVPPASFPRSINEKLYKSNSSEAVKMIKEDPEVFQVVGNVSIVFLSNPQSFGSSTTLVSDIRCNLGLLIQFLITSTSFRNVHPNRSLQTWGAETQPWPRLYIQRASMCCRLTCFPTGPLLPKRIFARAFRCPARSLYLKNPRKGKGRSSMLSSVH